MKTISMDLINQVKEIKEKTGISTRSAMEILSDTGVCKESELPDVETMDAILRGIEEKQTMKERVHV